MEKYLLIIFIARCLFFPSRMRRIFCDEKWQVRRNVKLFFSRNMCNFATLMSYKINYAHARAYSVRQDEEKSGIRSVNVCTRQEEGKRKWKWMEVDWRREQGTTSGVLIKNVERVAHARRDGADVIKSKRTPDAAGGNNQLLAVHEGASWFRFCALKIQFTP